MNSDAQPPKSSLQNRGKEERYRIAEPVRRTTATEEE
jgi:hypothetical protein